MRWLNWALALCIICLAVSSAYSAGCSTCNGNDMASYRSLRGPACYSPPGYCLTPGCCECPPSACDNAWDGYCQEKARWQAFFTCVGTPKAHHHGCPTMMPVEAEENCQMTSSQIQPRPTPATQQKVTRLPYPTARTPYKTTGMTKSQW
jgi:hypothetical protein